MNQLPTQNEVLAYTQASIAKMVNWIDSKFLTEFAFDLKPILGFKIAKRWGSAGTHGTRQDPYMKLNLGSLTAYPVLAFTEYRSYSWDYQIGSFATNDWRLWVDTLIAHELSHVVQHHLLAHRQPDFKSFGKSYYNIGKNRVLGESGHGDMFQIIYRMLRVEFINSRATGIGRYTSIRAFDAPEEERKVKRPQLKNHPLVGQTFEYGGRTWTVEAFLPTMKKYNTLCINGNKLSRFEMPHVTRLVDATRNAA